MTFSSKTESPILKIRVGVLAIALATFTLSAHAQGALPRCAVAQMIVAGAVKGYDARKQGVPMDQQVKGVQVMAGKLATTYGPNVGKTYGDVETKILQNLYENDQYSDMTRAQFDEAMTAAFYHDPSCPQST